MFNLIADLNWLALSDTAALWLGAYREAVALLFSPLAPLLARTEFEFTAVEQQVFVAVALLVGSTWRGLMTGPTTKEWYAENRPDARYSRSSGPPAKPLNPIQITFVIGLAVSLMLLFFLVAPIWLALIAVTISMLSVMWYGAFLHPEPALRRLRLLNVAAQFILVIGWLFLVMLAAQFI